MDEPCFAAAGAQMLGLAEQSLQEVMPDCVGGLAMAQR